MAFDPSTARPIDYGESTGEPQPKPSSKVRNFDPSTARPLESTQPDESANSLQFDPSTAKPVEPGFLDKARETVGDIQQGSIETAISLGKRVESAKGSFVQSAGRMFTSTGRDMAIQQSQRATNTEKVIDAIDRGEIDPQDWFGQAQEKFDLSANDFDSRAVNLYAKGDEQARAEIRQDLEQIPKDPRESKTFEVANQIDQFVAEKFKSDPEFREEFISGKIPDALGSFFGFAIPTLLTRGSTVATLGVTAGLGSSVNSAAQFEDAVKSGASLDEAFEAADIAGIVGTSEAVPIVSILNRIDKSTGGSIKKALLSAAKGGFEEGAQEAFQQTMSNVIASDLVEYDPDRNAFQGTGENAGLGFTVGGLVSFLGSLIGGRRGSSAPDYLDDAPTARERPQEPGASQPPTQEPVTQSARRPEPIAPLDEMAEIVNASDAELNQMLDEYLAADVAPINEGVRTVRQGEERAVPDTTPEMLDQAQPEAAQAQPEKPTQDRRTDPERPDRGARRRLQTPKDFLEQRHREKVEQFGLTPEQAEAFAPQVDTDPTTGYFGKRDLEPTIERAQQHVEETGEPGVYVETDISNMGGGNAKLGTRQFDEQFYTPAANIMREELESTGADVIPVRKGGDENGFIVVNGAPEVVEQAMRSAQARIAELAQETGLSDVPHTKEEAKAAGLRGVGLYYGLSNIRPGDSVSQILSGADRQVEARKKEQPDVNRSTTQAPQTEPPAADRAGQGAEAPDRGGPQGRAGAFDPATARPVEQAPAQAEPSATIPSMAEDQRGGRSTSQPQPHERPDTITLYHGGSEQISEISDGGGFGGVFANANRGSAQSHGDTVTEISLPDSQVLTQQDLSYSIPYEKTMSALKEAMPWISEENQDLAYDAVIEEENVFEMNEDQVLDTFKSENLGEASWEAQRIRGEVAKGLGYRAVEMQDEHGTSYLVLPGPTTPDPSPRPQRAGQTEPQPAPPREGRRRSATRPQEPAVPEGKIRVYHSGSQGEGETGRWVSTNRQYASDYRGDLPFFYIDLPASDPRVNNEDYPDQSVAKGFTFNFELTPSEAARLKEIPRKKPTQPQEARDEETQRQEPPETEVLTPQTFDSRRPETPQTTPSPEGVSDSGLEKLDQEYLDAVERGDKAEALRLVLRASGIKKVSSDIDRGYGIHSPASPNVKRLSDRFGNRETVSRSAPTKTKAFQEWFGDSKVVDENGEPLVVYHGTRNRKSIRDMGFVPDRDGSIYFTSTPQEAFRFGHEYKTAERPAKVEKVYLSLQNPLEVDYKGELFDPGQVQDVVIGAQARGHDGVVIRNIQNFEGGDVTDTYIAFESEQVKSVNNRGTFDPNDPNILNQTQSSRPGTQYAPLVEQSGNLPVESATEVVMADGRRVPIPEEPIRRRDIVKRLEKAFGVRVYQGKVKGKSRLGFYRTGVGEIRTKNKDHLEVTGHELAHWLDDRFTWIGNLYRSKPFKNEIKSVSYDESKIHEGYAEFMRLFFTDEAQAMDKAPKFYQAFTDKLKGTTLEAPIKDIQGMMHAWYRQGSLQRARSKIGESPAGAMDKIKEFWDWLTGEYKDQFFDDRAHIAKVEKTLNGRIGGSFSPYWSSRILQRVGAIADAVIHHGTIGYNRNDGSHYFTGESLDAAVLSKIEGREREYAEYAIGRRAKELKFQNRENNFTDDEIKALLSHAKKHTKFPKIFQAQQAFNKRMVDFLVESGVTSRDKADKMMEINQNYVSFKRVIDSFGKHGAISKQANPFMRLKGGTANVRNMFETMQENIETFIHLGVLNQFKTQFYQMIDTSQDSAMFATKIGKDVKPVQLNKSELASRLNKILGENWQNSGIQIDEEMLSDLVLFTGVDPKGDVDFYYKNGEKVFYEIGDGSLYKELTNLAGEKMGLTFKVWDTVFGKPKRLLTATATAFNLKFQIRNFLMRDLANRVYFTRAEKDSPVRVAGQAFKGLAESFGKSDAYWLARANGLGMESTYVGSQYAHTKKASIAPAFNWWQKATLGKDKAIDELIEFVGHPEMANRLAEYKQLTAEGKTPREGAIGGIDVSVDFRRRGRHELIRYIANGSAFFNPRIQGLYKIGEELTNLDPDARDGYIRRRAAVVAARALWTTTLPAMALWYFNHDDERYQNLPDDVRDQNFVVYYGTGEDDYFLVAKSFEMGSMFASTPERVLDAVAEKDGRELAESMSLMAAETLSLDPRPSLWQVEQEITQNKTWTGAPIIPNWLNDKVMEKSRYFDDRTSQTARWLGEKLDVRPDHLEHRFRGYTSMIGDLTLTMTDYWLRQENQVDPEMTYQDYVSKYVGLLPRSGEPYRTEAQKDFYELATEADKVFNTFNDMIARPGEYETLNERLQEYLNPDERKVYFSTQEAFNNARGIITELNNTADAIRQATDMSAEEKREQMEEIKKGKNQVYEQITKEFSPEQIEELEKQLSDPRDE